MDATQVESYDQLIQILRERICELGIIYDTVDSVTGLTAGYSARLLARQPTKHMGAISLFPVLTALGLRLRIEPDDDAVEKLSQRSDWYLLTRKGPRFRPAYNRRQRAVAAAD